MTTYNMGKGSVSATIGVYLRLGLGYK